MLVTDYRVKKDLTDFAQFVGNKNEKKLIELFQDLLLDLDSVTTVIEGTYTEITSLETANALIPGVKYKITDFQTLHKLQGSSERNDTNVVIPIEPLTLTAKSESEFENVVYSELYPNDIIHYTTDNGAWNDLTITGQKGCITFRKDPIRNIEIGNGDWRNFIVRRWAADLSATGRGTRWILWSPSMSCGLVATGTLTGQAFVAMSTSVYDASTNPTGYKDVRICIPDYGASQRGTVNTYIKRSTDGQGTAFMMPNIHIEGYGSSYPHFNNVKITSCTNNTWTNEIYDLDVVTMKDCIFTDVISYVNGFSGFFNSVFSNAKHFASICIKNLNGVTFYMDIINRIISGDISNVSTSVINATSSHSNSTGYLKVRNSQNVLIAPTLGRGKVCIVDNFDYVTTKEDDWVGNNLKNLSALGNIHYSRTFSDITVTMAAVAAMAPTAGRDSTSIDLFAGIINLTGAGTVNMTSFVKNPTNNFSIVLKPAAGLTISIAHSNIANGFVQAATVTANGTNGEVIILTPIGDRWVASN
jgi:hypothetical protein